MFRLQCNSATPEFGLKSTYVYKSKQNKSERTQFSVSWEATPTTAVDASLNLPVTEHQAISEA